MVMLATMLLGLALGGGAALAQGTPASPTVKADDGFVPVNGDMMQQGETIPGNKLVAAAYGFISVALLVWVASVAMRARKLEDEVEELKRKLGPRPEAGGAVGPLSERR
jgi:hypothetical protein